MGLVGSPARTVGGSRLPVSGAGGFTAFALPKFAAGLTNVKNNVSDAYFVDWGDSTRAGVAYGTPAGNPALPYTNGARPFAPATQFAARMAAKGVKVSTDAVYGFNLMSTTTAAEYNAYNSQLQLDTATWTPSTAATLGGWMFRKASATPGAMIFTPSATCNSFDVRLANNTGAYTFLVDGVQTSTYTTTGTNALVTINVPCPNEGIHVLSIDTTTSAVANVASIIARSSTKRLIVINAGWRAATAVTMADDQSGSLQLYKGATALPALAPTLVVISPGINDARTSGGNTTKAAFDTALSDLVGFATPSADVILSSPSGISPANDTGTGVHMSDVYDSYVTRGVASGLMLSNTTDLVGSYATLNAAGKYASDGLHIVDRAVPQTIGYKLADMAYDGAIAAGYVP